MSHVKATLSRARRQPIVFMTTSVYVYIRKYITENLLRQFGHVAYALHTVTTLIMKKKRIIIQP